MECKVGFDVGGSLIKFSFYDKEGHLVNKHFLNRVEENLNAKDGMAVCVEDTTYSVGSIGGTINHSPRKVNYGYMKHILFRVAYEIRKHLKTTEDMQLDIVTCLPPTQLRESKEAYKALLYEVDGLVGEVNGEVFRIYIENVRCGAEGVSLLKGYELERLGSDRIKIMLLDIGSSTTDIILLDKAENCWHVRKAETSRIAGASICRDIASCINGMYQSNYEWQDLEVTGTVQIRGKVYDICDFIDESATASIEALIKDIERVGSLIEYYPVLTGRGARLLASSARFQLVSEFEMLEDTIRVYGNAIGALKS